MKMWLVVVIVLSLAAAARADLRLSVNGQIDPPYPIALTSGQTANIGIWSDGGGLADGVGYLVVSGPAAADIAGASHYVSEELIYVVGSGPFQGAVGFDLKDADPENSPFLPGGTLVDNITLGSNGTGQIELKLWFDETGGQPQLMDTQVFNMAPEPMTIGLLGLGGLFLCHRKR